MLKDAGADRPAPTEDELQHDSQKNLNPNNKTKASAKPDYSQGALEKFYYEVMGDDEADG